MTSGEREYLVCYDYGSGALWWWIKAQSPEQIMATYEDVIVLEEAPAWCTDETDRRVKRLTVGETVPGLVGR